MLPPIPSQAILGLGLVEDDTTTIMKLFADKVEMGDGSTLVVHAVRTNCKTDKLIHRFHPNHPKHIGIACVNRTECIGGMIEFMDLKNGEEIPPHVIQPGELLLFDNSHLNYRMTHLICSDSEMDGHLDMLVLDPVST